MFSDIEETATYLLMDGFTGGFRGPILRFKAVWIPVIGLKPPPKNDAEASNLNERLSDVVKMVF